MDPKRWERLQALFHEAAGLPAAERDAFVEAHTGSDDEMRRQLVAMLADLSTADPVDEAIGAAAADLAGAAVADAVSGKSIGPYRIERLIGQGGMGAVYLASRSDEAFEKQVAIKLLAKAGPDAVQRFVAERQILASLEHPNISRLLDGGTTETGLPYVVMEYVDGRQIDDFCDDHDLSIDRRVELFLQVCDAVQYAHRNLVVHRDIKPGNILVPSDGAPKLLDFGIAKLIDTADRTDLTATSARVMTPDYASPEQVRGEPVTIASDVYSLGVLLYNLLTGKRPYKLTSESLGELERAITGQEPERPSRIVSELEGDLDAIVLMALRKEADRRYASVRHFADDLRRYLDGLPVTARSESWRYRTGKFVQRHTLGVAAAAAFVVLLAGFGVTMAVQAARLAEERDTSEQVTAFLLDMFDKADPRSGEPRDLTVLELVDSGATRIRTELDDRPAVRSRLLASLGLVLEQLGDFDRAVELLEETRDEVRALHGEDSVEYAEALSNLGNAYRMRGEYDRAAEPVDRGAALYREHLGPDDPAQIDAMWAAAMLRFDTDRAEEAETILLESLDIAERGLPAPSEEAAHAVYLLAVARSLQGDFDGAIDYSLRALDLRRELHAEDSVALADSWHNLAVQYEDASRLEEALEAAQEALRIRRLRLPPDHTDIGGSLNSIMEVYREMGRYEEAVEAGREALAVRRAAFGGRDHMDVARVLNNLALVLNDGGFDGADEMFQESLAMRGRLFGEDHPSVGWSWNNLGWMYYTQGRWQPAADAFVRAKAILYDGVDEIEPTVPLVLKNLGGAREKLGQPAEAERLYRLAIDEAERVLPPDHAYRGTFHQAYGLMLLDQRRYDEAEPHLRDSLTIYEAGLPADHPALSRSRRYHGEVLWKLGRLDEAETLLVAARDTAGTDELREAAADMLAEFYEATGRTEAAAQYR